MLIQTCSQMSTGDYLDNIDGYWGFLGQTVLALHHFIIFVIGPIVHKHVGAKPHLNVLHDKLLFVNTTKSTTLKEIAASVFSFMVHIYLQNI